MSDLENQEIETTEEMIEQDPIGDFIDSIASGDFNQSEKLFNDLLADKMDHALEAEKISVAGSIFNGVEDTLEYESEEDIDEE